MIHPIIAQITQHLKERSQASRSAYLAKLNGMRLAQTTRLSRQQLAAPNQAHGYASLGSADKIKICETPTPMIGIISAYNDVLSAHQPYKDYPDSLKKALNHAGALGHVAGGTPAMCDGVTQGQPGMELSLFSRDVIAMSTAIALSHGLYDGVLLLGVCDKIVPGLLLGALSFGHLPAIFVPAGPMPSGLSNKDKSFIREQHAQGLVNDKDLLTAEMKSYHSSGTCTFYGTANSNQVLLEAMGLMLPGAGFIQPTTPLRTSFNQAAAFKIAHLTLNKNNNNNNINPYGLGELITAESIVNAVVALLATGGSTNHTIHWVAIAKAAGFCLTWDDFDALSKVVPLITRLYPNGSHDVNDFHAAGGTAYLFKTLIESGLMFDSVLTVNGQGLRQSHYTHQPHINQTHQTLDYFETHESLNINVLRPVNQPFQTEGGLKVMRGHLGIGIVKTSAVKPQYYEITAPCAVFDSQEAVRLAFKAGELNRDVVVVVKNQGPKACGMPELHQLTPILTVLQQQGYHVALLTDGRMSGASGTVLSVIHITPESASGGLIGQLCNGDMITLNAHTGLIITDQDIIKNNNNNNNTDNTRHHIGVGRELFACFRHSVSPANEGAMVF